MGVKTTGIFCRPSCSARKPKRANVEFFPAAREALAAGYRPCKRCAPMSLHEPEPAWLRRIHAELEARAGRAGNHVGRAGRMRDADLVRLGIAPSTARRYFLSRHGMTFHAYCRARRLGGLLGELRNPSARSESILETSRPARAPATPAPRSLRPPRTSRGESGLQACWLDTPLGGMVAVADSAGLCLLEFVDRRALESELAALRARFNSPVQAGDNEHLDRAATQIREYFDGVRRQFEMTLNQRGSAFQRRVWENLQAIPFGHTRSYAQIARIVGVPGGSRAIGLANGKNSIAIVVPCHRVIRSDGTLCGYGGGVHRKRWLLDHERRVAGDEVPGLLPI